MSRLVYQNADVRKSSAFAFACLREVGAPVAIVREMTAGVFFGKKECGAYINVGRECDVVFCNILER